ncbi:MAG TPA: MFS transporter [Kineosporiaceae bacterium]|nr:MFS transporter [Kineosporiaceae bacterium]
MTVREETMTDRRGAAPRITFAVLAAGFILTSLDMMIVNVAYPDIKSHYHLTGDTLVSWTLNAYTVMYASALIPMGGIADHYGRRRVFLTGLGVFTLASLACALSPDITVLVAARALQAVGAAALTPTSMALLLQVFPRERHQRVIGLWVSAGALAAALAPVVGGVLVQIDWRLIFVINLPIGLIAAALAAKILPADEVAGGAIPDLATGILLGLGVTGVVYTLILLPTVGSDETSAWGAACIAAVALGIALARNSRAPHPLIPAAVMDSPGFRAVNAAAFVYSVGFAVMLLGVILWSQGLMGYSPLQSGLAIAPGTLLMPYFAARTPAICGRYGTYRTAAAGCLVLGAGMGWWAFAAGRPLPYAVQILPGCLLTSVGTIIGMAALAGSIARIVPKTSYAVGSAVHTTAKQLGIAVGVALTLCIYGLVARRGHATEGIQAALIVGLLLETVAAGTALYGERVTQRQATGQAQVEGAT